MKPLPLLITLSALALAGAVVLMQQKPAKEQRQGSQLTPLSNAPLPIDYVEPEAPLPLPPLLEEDLTPDSALVAFVENHLELSFPSPPIFQPVPAEEVILTIAKGVDFYLPENRLQKLNTLTKGLGILQDFQELDQIIITILAGEMRGLVTPTRNLILNDFQASSPPEQAALVNLLAQKLLFQRLPVPTQDASIDEILANHFARQSLALATEKEFRKTLPDYPPSLNENLRESILLGLPSFFHELSTFAEFHLLSQVSNGAPAEVLSTLTNQSPVPSRALLTFPFAAKEGGQASEFGAIPLYLILLEATDPTTARTLATTLVKDEIAFQPHSFSWILSFDSPKNPPRVAEQMRSYYALRNTTKSVDIAEREQEVVITIPLESGM